MIHTEPYPEGTKFIIIELQKDANGNVAIATPSTYDNQNEADSKFFTTMAAAAVSSVPKHSVTMLHENGYVIRNETYIHGGE